MASYWSGTILLLLVPGYLEPTMTWEHGTVRHPERRCTGQVAPALACITWQCAVGCLRCYSKSNPGC